MHTLLRNVDVRTSTGDERLLSVTKAKGVVPRDQITDEPPRAESLIGYKRCKRGDLVVNQMSAYDGLMGVAPCDGIVTYHYLVFRPIADVSTQFLALLLSSDVYRQDFRRRVRGLGEALQANVRTPHIRIEDFLHTVAALPPRALQDEIAASVLKAREEIYAEIGNRKKMVARLEAILDAVVAEEMARTDAQPTPFKYLFKRRRETPLPGDETVTAFRDGQVTLRSRRRTDGFTEAVHEHGYQRVAEGDLVVSSMDGFAGAIGVAEASGKCTPAYHIWLPTSFMSPAFATIALRLLARSGYLESLAKGIRTRSSSFDANTLANLKIPAPPPEVQQEIERRVESVRASVRGSQSAIGKQIRLLRATDRSLHHAHVTGQLRSAAGE
ncbi:MAG: hypothetical protein WEB09_01095 [Nitriliruptor sp.]